jgi:hypothetical protein
LILCLFFLALCLENKKDVKNLESVWIYTKSD